MAPRRLRTVWKTLREGYLGVALALIGCTTLTPDQQTTLAFYQERADTVTAAYRVGKVYFLIGAHNSAAGGTMGIGGLMTMETIALDTKDDVLVAHELGHWVLNHAGWPFQSLQHRYRQEMDANVEAVKILTIGWGWTEQQAYLAVLNRLWQVKRSAQAVPDGHPPDPCIEIADLVRRFPRHAALGQTCETP